MKVVLADIDEANLTKAETELKTPGGTVLGVRTDVSKRGDVERLARQALDLPRSPIPDLLEFAAVVKVV